MEREEFLEYLLLFSRDVDEELDEFVWTEGKAKVCEWLTPVLGDWVRFAKNLSQKDQNVLLWRIGGNPLFIGWWLEARSNLILDQTELLYAAKEVTLSVPHLFGPGEPMENGYFMWWDLLATDIDPHLADGCLEILTELSWHPDDRVQYAALHGLGHLKHPRRPAAVDDWVRRHPEAKGDRWILECREGTVM